MSGAPDEVSEVQRLARSLATSLAHLRDFRGLRYVSAAPMPRAPEAADDAPPRSIEDEVAPASTRGPSAAPRQAPRPDAAPAVSAMRPPVSASSTPPAERPRGPSPASAEVPRPRSPASAEAPRPRSPAPASEPRVTRPAADASSQGQPRSDAREWPAARKLDYLREKNLGNCQRCALARTRSNIVFGVGSPEAELMFVGEAPGQQEDRQGIPFVGRAGERLNLWLDMLAIPRDHVYIANVLKCRPPNNRDPEPEEVARCSPFLRAQIRAIRPKVLVALGRFAGCLLLGVAERPMHQMRGRVWSYQEEKLDVRIPVVVTYHPSYVLRQGKDRPPGKSDADASVLTDLRQVVGILRGP